MPDYLENNFQDSDNDGIPDHLDPDSSRNVGGGNNPDDTTRSVQTNTDQLSGSTETILFCLLLIAGWVRRSKVASAALRSGLIAATLMASQVAQATTADAEPDYLMADSPALAWYLGAGLGVSFFDPEVSGTAFSIDDEYDTGFSFLGGFHISEQTRIEMVYSDLGSANITSNTQAFNIDYSAFSIDGLFNVIAIPALNLTGYGSVGLTSMDTDSPVAIDEKNSINVKFGVGVEYQMENGYAARLSADKFSGDAHLFSLSLLKYFESKQEATASTQPIDTFVGSRMDNNIDHNAALYSKDSDQDGVADNQDHCPDTLASISVDERGCGIFNQTFPNITFDVNSANLTPSAKEVLNNIAHELKKVPHVTVEVQAHTDATGSDFYNIWLSNKRADSIVTYLALHGISKSQLYPQGYGKTKPVANNKTKAGRAENRRAEFKIIPKN